MRISRPSLFLSLAGLTLVLGVGVRAADPPAAPKASAFAPVDDLDKQLTYYLDRIDKALADKAEYDEGKQSRVKKDANTVAILALTIGMHDGEHKLKANAGGVIKAAQELSKASDKFEGAKAASEAMQKAATATAGTKVTKWEKAGDMVALMKAVPLINNTLKKAAADLAKGKNAETAAGAAATMAAIAQGTLVDTEAVKNAADTPKWYQFSAEMRDAAGEVNKLAKAKDQAAMAAAMSKLSKTCEDCHAVFRKEEK